jgi:hypothetical protein
MRWTKLFTGQSMRSKQSLCVLVLALIVTVLMGDARGQNSTNDQKQEQTAFEAEPDGDVMHIDKPVKIPEGALQVLRDLSRSPADCLKDSVTPSQVPASWFIASAIHLNGPDEVDLVVLLNEPAIAHPDIPGGCMLPANGNYFWVLAPESGSGKYKLLLESYGHGLNVLNSRTNHYRDIQIGMANLNGATTLLFKFATQQYELAEKKQYKNE